MDPELHQSRGAPGLMFTVGPLGVFPRKRNSRGIAGMSSGFWGSFSPFLSGYHTTRSRQYGDGHVLAETLRKNELEEPGSIEGLRSKCGDLANVTARKSCRKRRLQAISGRTKGPFFAGICRSLWAEAHH